MNKCQASPRHWVVHDYLQVNGGAERLVLALARGLPGWGLVVSGIYPDFSGTGSTEGVHVRILGRWLCGLPRVARALLCYGGFWGRLRPAETVVYSGIYAPLAVFKQRRGLKILYCHTPPRFAFDRQQRYEQRWPSLLRPLLRVLIAWYRNSYLRALGRMDVILTNSEHVRQRLKALTGHESTVVYPPVDTSGLAWRAPGNYYLSLGRLEPLKRVERVIQAFLTMPQKRLVVISGGSERARLMSLASGASNIEFTDWVDEQQLQHWLGSAIASLYIPEDEDFGMSAVESMAAGKPVIAVDEGGLCESVIDGQTGVLLAPDPSAQAIAQAVLWLTPERALAMRWACEQRASEFDTQRFLFSFTSLLRRIQAQSQ